MKWVNILNKIKEKFKFKDSKNKRATFLIIFCIVIVIVIFCLPSSNYDSSKSSGQTKSSEVSTDLSYLENLENKISSMLMSVDKITFAQVAILSNEAEENVYLKSNETTKTTNGTSETTVTKEEYIYEKTGSSQSPVKVSTTYPKVSGVLIVTNKIDAVTKNNITKALSIVLNIDESCIYILLGS